LLGIIVVRKFYFDTSIWLDFFEKRNEPSLPKGDFVIKLVDKILKNNFRIVYSEVVKNEMIELGYLRYDLEPLFFPLKSFLIYVESNKKQFGKAKDLSKKREIPLFDALHAILARDSRSTLITRDRHFDMIKDIIRTQKPEEFI